MLFKKNYHRAKNLTIRKIDNLIRCYPSKYPTPKYLIFAKKMYHDGWKIKIYVANKVSKYIFLTKGDKIIKIRFSNHKPLYSREIENDCDYYVGISHTQVTTTEKLIEKLCKNTNQQSKTAT